MRRRLHSETSAQTQTGKYLFLILIYFFLNCGLHAEEWRAGIHDPSSIIKCKDKYWIFGTGDGIFSRYSTDLVTWTAGPTPFTKTVYPAWISTYVKGATDAQGNAIFHGNFWAPDIIFMNNMYYLYYSCSEWGTMTSTIGCVTNKTLDPADSNYKWEDLGFLGIWSYRAGIALNAIDPSIVRGNDGRIWMTYGSFNQRGIVITELDTLTGKPKTYSGNIPGTTIANSWTGPGSTVYGEGEGSCMIFNNGYYYLFYNKGGCCAGVNSTYYIVVGRSVTATGPFVDKTGKVLVTNNSTKSGGTVIFKHDDTRGLNDRYYGPGHLAIFKENGIDYATFHYYDPNWDYSTTLKGGPTLGLAKLIWGTDGWPKISMDFLDKGFYSLKNVNSSKAMDLQSHAAPSGQLLYQYTASNLYDTQKWLFTPLGTGEYTIRSYADTTKYLEASGVTTNDEFMRVATSYTGAVNQKFRLVKSTNGKIIIYPSVSDKLFEIPNAYTADYQIKTWYNTNHACQRWIATPFNETLSTSVTDVHFSYTDTTCTTKSVISNGSWNLSVDDNSWFTVTPTSGQGNATLTIHATENLAAISRSNRIVVKSKGGNTSIIAINQNEYLVTDVELTKLIQVDVNPNPTYGMVHIKCSEPAELRMFNNTGSEIMSVRLSDTDTEIDMSNMTSGLYLLKISNAKGTVIKKIMKR